MTPSPSAPAASSSRISGAVLRQLEKGMSTRLLLILLLLGMLGGGTFLADAIRHASRRPAPPPPPALDALPSSGDDAQIVLERNLLNVQRSDTEAPQEIPLGEEDPMPSLADPMTGDAPEQAKDGARQSEQAPWTVLGLVTGDTHSVFLKIGAKTYVVFRQQSVQGWMLEDIQGNLTFWRRDESTKILPLTINTSAGEAASPPAPSPLPTLQQVQKHPPPAKGSGNATRPAGAPSTLPAGSTGPTGPGVPAGPVIGPLGLIPPPGAKK